MKIRRHLHFSLLLWLLVATTSLLATGAYGQGQADIMAKLKFNDQTYIGQPLGWDGKRLALVDRAGGLNLIPASTPDAFEKVADQYIPYSKEQIASLLMKEFGSRYDISKTDRYVVVHPWGPSSVFAPPFEAMHARFVDFFESNGIELRPVGNPQVAIVLRSRSDFNRYLINEVEAQDSRIGGYYSRTSNRITTFDPQGLIRQKGDDWLYTAGPIIHEATHQSAFNTGLHNRFAPPPKWISEGVATLFEARGFNHATDFTELRDRVNPERLKVLRRRIAKGSVRNALFQLIANDNLFRSDVELAYALSWGLSFYLYETQPEKYFDLLRKDAKRKNFVAYSPEQRLRDFVNVFGNDFEKLVNGLTHYFTPQKKRKSGGVP